MRGLSLGLAGLALLGACGEAGRDPVYTQFHRESGAVIDTGTFGDATRRNTAAMTGAATYAAALGQRFAAEVPTTVTFAFNSAALDGTAQAVLDQQAGWIRQFPEVRFRVYGHTDLVGSDAYNRALGLRRAQAVVRYLGSRGVDLSRLDAVVSEGETQPLVVTQGRERQSRRTVTDVLGFVASHPGVLDGKYAQIVYRDYVRSAEPGTTLSSGTAASVDAAGGG
ncbi:membrane protein [Roseivivax halodurans JCM 10272]|uniref:Membrane protein n=1 Tax=Roseivivax halodurans JCM 10272 TaxID=1449350 RepID=X7EG15_9RHOB|nr:OmpA family protein [Roseivivax halodurans]ETX14815.1 membrane protein [Roseivivax halodurans JCM 10272]